MRNCSNNIIPVPPLPFWKVLYDLPRDTHPMEMFSAAILILERDSQFRHRYTAGMRKEDYWELRFELTRKLKEELEAGGCSIPFPQRTVHMIQSPAPKPAAKKKPAASKKKAA